MDITPGRANQMKIVSLLELAAWLESSLGASLTPPTEEMVREIEQIGRDPFLSGYKTNPRINKVPGAGIAFLRYYALHNIENSLIYPGTHSVDMSSFISSWCKEYVDAMSIHHRDVAREFQDLRNIMFTARAIHPGVKMQYQSEIDRLNVKHAALPPDAEMHKHRFEDKIDRLLSEFKYDLKSFVGNNPWIMHRVIFRGSDLIIEKMEDYRILEWTELNTTGSLEEARAHHYKVKEDQ